MILEFSTYVGIVIECPFGDRLPTCPIYEINNIPLNSRIEWFCNLKTTEKQKIVLYHRNCLKNREERAKNTFK